jgi:hypothetical protein
LIVQREESISSTSKIEMGIVPKGLSQQNIPLPSSSTSVRKRKNKEVPSVF